MSYDFKSTQKEIKQFWKDINLLEKIKSKNKDGQRYFLLDGPPYANFVPHVGHVRNTVYKDLYIRWEFMKGSNVLFQPGFDTHGLPIENMVEKKLHLTCKKDILNLGISVFMRQCRDSAALNKDLWMAVYEDLGTWYAWKKPYLTYNNSYIESAWWAFRKLWDKDMVYEGKKPVFWCPKCQTALAGYETTDSYKMLSDPAIYVKFRLKDSDESVLVFTTTPWTLPANVAIFAHPDREYVRVSTPDHGIMILAKKRLGLLDKFDIAYKVINEFKGSELDGLQYEPLLDVPAQRALSTNLQAHRIYMSVPILKERVASKIAMKKDVESGEVFEDFVTDEEGTGFVHCAPGHGKSDNEVGKHYHLPEVSPVDDEGKFTEDAAPFTGKFVKDADTEIAEIIQQNGGLLNLSRIEHSYPLCWRCKSPLIYRLSDQWFIKIDSIKNQMLRANENVNWQPEFARERFRTWVANAEDWNFSRQRYWGIPIPVWKCKCGKHIVISSFSELQEKAAVEVSPDFDLHSASEIPIRCECGKLATRINDIFDVWYDSGCAPFASLHYPFENKELFDSHYPVSRVNESQDQIRGWFYSLMFVNMGTFDKAPYEIVSMPGWVLDKKGEKMSKSVGNVVWARDGIAEYSADALRFYYCWDIAPSSTQKFNVDTLTNEVSKYFTILWNISTLVTSKSKTMQAPRWFTTEDLWIRSRLHSTIKQVHDAIESFEIHEAGRALYEFVINDVSRHYIQIVRNRMGKDMEPYYVLNYTLTKIIRLSASITPFISEKIHQVMRGQNSGFKESVHLEPLPQPDISMIKTDLETAMDFAKEVISAILSARDRAKIGVRWPLRAAIIDTVDEKVKKGVEILQDIILEQTNIKELRIEEFEVKLIIKPNFNRIGRDFGKDTPNVAKVILANTPQILEAVKAGDKEFKVSGYVLTKEYITVTKEVSKDYEIGEFRKGCVFIETHMDDALLAEGYAREFIRRIQQARKNSGLNKEDSIVLTAQVDTELKVMLDKHAEAIRERIGVAKMKLTEEPIKDSFQYNGQSKIKDTIISFGFNKI